MKLLALALTPGLALLLFIYLKDKYEREPLKLVLKAFFYGIVAGGIIIIAWLGINMLNIHLPQGTTSWNKAFYDAFYYAAIPEEAVKFMVMLLFFFKAKDFNEWFDGIVYAVAISLGFATLENIFYVLEKGASVGFMRAIFAVPSHFIDGVTQGFFFSLAKFGKRKLPNIIAALIFAIIVHGIYDFLLMTGKTQLLIVFLFYFVLIVILARKLINSHLEKSQFKNSDYHEDY